jgi:hypothetical protein
MAGTAATARTGAGSAKFAAIVFHDATKATKRTKFPS